MFSRLARRGLLTVTAVAVALSTVALPRAVALPVTQTEPTIPACGARSTADITVPAAPPPTEKFRVVVDPGQVKVPAFRIWRGKKPDQDRYVLLVDGGRVQIFDAKGRRTADLDLGLTQTGDLAVDSRGNIYAVEDGSLLSFDPEGKRRWSTALPDGEKVSSGVYAYATDGDERIGVTGQNGSLVFGTDGRARGRSVVTGSRVNQSEATGNLVSAADGYVRIFSPDGAEQLRSFGSPLKANDAGPFHFYILNAADELADGTVLVSDKGNGLHVFDANNGYVGVARYGSELDSGVTGAIGQFAYLSIRDGQAVYALDGIEAAPGPVATLSVDAVLGYARGPQGAPGKLGIGAGPFTRAPGNYFPAGQAPKVFLQFDSWWRAVSDKVSGEYTIRDLRQVRSKTAVKATPFTLDVAATGQTDVPVTVPSTAPGFYQMDVRLVADGKTIGADCLAYSIGPKGATFDPAKLGEGNVAKVNLTAAFGQRLLRADFSFEDVLGDDPATPLTFPADFDAQWKAAADAAAAKGVTLEVQIATGSDLEKKLVATKQWGPRVEELVTRLKPYVKAWELWNEPNNTFGEAADYTEQVLKPAYAAIKKADPDAKVIGGAILGVDRPYLQTMIDSGALDAMDVLGLHPYTGHNRSFEEQGTPRELAAVRTMLAKAGKPDLPIWDTESGFWNSPVSSYLRQGDKLVRKVVLEHAAGIDMYSNFYLDGDFQVEGQSWALAPSVLTPGGLAMVNFATRTQGLRFQKLVPTSIPHTYGALYGPEGGEPTLLVAWAEDFDVSARVAGVDGAAVLDAWGGPVRTEATPEGATLTLSGAPTYLPVVPGGKPSLAAAESFGPNLALAKTGAKASATSATKENPASAAIDGVMDTQNKGGNREGVSAWIQSWRDDKPALTVELPKAQQVNRVLVSSQGLDSVQTGLRSYDVQVRNGDAAWQTVAQVRNDFLARNHLVRFDPQTATAIRVTNLSVNYAGSAFGLRPTWWPTDAKELEQDDVWGGQTVVYELEAYAPGRGDDPAPTESVTPEPSAPGTTGAGESGDLGTYLIVGGGAVLLVGLVLGAVLLLRRLGRP